MAQRKIAEWIDDSGTAHHPPLRLLLLIAAASVVAIVDLVLMLNGG